MALFVDGLNGPYQTTGQAREIREKEPRRQACFILGTRVLSEVVVW